MNNNSAIRQHSFKYNFTVASKSILRTLVLLGICFIMIYPVLYMIANSFMSVSDNYNPSVVWLPEKIDFQSYKLVMGYLDYFPALFRSFLITVPCVLIQFIPLLMAGYGFARFNFKFKKFLFGLLVFTIIVPAQTYIIPSYVNMSSFNFFGIGKLIGLFTGTDLTINLINTNYTFYLPALFGAGIRSGLNIYIICQFFKGLPKELEEAATIDGCNSSQVFFKIMIPNIIPAITTVSVFSIVWYFNDYLLSGFYLNENMPVVASFTMVKSIVDMASQSSGLVGITATDLKLLLNSIMCAGGLLVSIPLILMYLPAQRFFTENIGKSGIVG